MTTLFKKNYIYKVDDTRKTNVNSSMILTFYIYNRAS